MQGVRVATYNVHSCIGVDGRCDPERIAAVIAEMDPDVACLQELDLERARTGAIDQAREIARILRMEFHFHATIDEVSGRYGDAVLAKTPLRVVEATYFPAVPRPWPREARGAIWVETSVQGRRWQIINTHFGLGYGERRLQAQALVRDWIEPGLNNAPIILCGDFNSRSTSSIHRILGTHLRDVFAPGFLPRPRTFSTRWPLFCLDYIYVSSGVTIRHAGRWTSTIAARASDHFPVVADLDLSRGDQPG